MAGTLIIYHCPMRPIKIKHNYTINTISTINNIEGKYESPNSKQESQKRVTERKQISFSIIFVGTSPYRSHSVPYIVLKGVCPWIRGGCIACSRDRGGFQCGADVHPNNHAQRTNEILQLPFFLASLVFWLFLQCILG